MLCHLLSDKQTALETSIGEGSLFDIAPSEPEPAKAEPKAEDGGRRRRGRG